MINPEGIVKKSVSVVGAVILRDGKIFAAQRSADMALPLMWEFPGGKIEAGETPEEALVRELHEELGCRNVRVGSRVEATTYEYDFAVVSLTTFLVDIGSQDIELAEHASAKWVLPSELATLEWAPADIPAVRELEKAFDR